MDITPPPEGDPLQPPINNDVLTPAGENKLLKTYLAALAKQARKGGSRHRGPTKGAFGKGCKK